MSKVKTFPIQANDHTEHVPS